MKRLPQTALVLALTLIASCKEPAVDDDPPVVIEHEITFNANGGSGIMEAQAIAEGKKKNLTANGFSCDCFLFSGWATTPDGAVEYLNAVPYPMGTSDVTLYAVWQWDTSTTLEDLAVGGYLDIVDMDDQAGISGGYLTDEDGSSDYVQTTINPDNSVVSFTHNITPFSIGRYEVTYDLWYVVRFWAEANGYTFGNSGRAGKYGVVGAAPTLSGRREPASLISWRDSIVWCNAYSELAGWTPCYTSSGVPVRDSRGSNAAACDSAVCDWNADGFRLPSEGEWQYAASCAATYPYNYLSGSITFYNDIADTHSYVDGVWTATPNGVPDNKDANDMISVYYSHITSSGGAGLTGVNSTAPVGSKWPNAFGLYDMSGNVWEWCWDVCGYLATGEKTDYRGASSGSNRITHGGGHDINCMYLVIGSRHDFSPDNTFYPMGLRVVRCP